MGMEHCISLGQGVDITEALKVYVATAPENEDEWPGEVLEGILFKDYGLLTFISGGGGYSESEDEYAVVIKRTALNLDDFDGLTEFGNTKQVTVDENRELSDFLFEITGTRVYFPDIVTIVTGSFR